MTLLVFWMASIGNTIFWLLGATLAGTQTKLILGPHPPLSGASMAYSSPISAITSLTALIYVLSILIVVGFHAMFYTPVEIDEFGFGEGLPTTMPAALPASAPSAVPALGASSSGL